MSDHLSDRKATVKQTLIVKNTPLSSSKYRNRNLFGAIDVNVKHDVYLGGLLF